MSQDKFELAKLQTLYKPNSEIKILSACDVVVETNGGLYVLVITSESKDRIVKLFDSITSRKFTVNVSLEDIALVSRVFRP